MTLLRIYKNIKALESRIVKIFGSYSGQEPPLTFGVDVLPSGDDLQARSEPRTETDAKSLIDAIFGDGFMWAAVPKKRVTWERGQKRHHGENKLRWNVESKKNIVTCLECGHYHKAHTVCGHCYEKVKNETKLMRQALDEKDPDAQMFNQPRTEVVYLYNDEIDDREKYNGKFIVEMKRDRPSWWSKNLLSKAHGKL